MKVTAPFSCEALGNGACVPITRLEALLRLLCPHEMTPQAQRVFELVLDEYRGLGTASSDASSGEETPA